MTMETPLAQVRALGSAQSGAHHWGVERLTSISTLALLVWLVVSLLRLPDLHYGTVTIWLARPIAAVPMLLLIVSVFWHLKIGLQVVVEDYVHGEGGRLFWIVAINFASIFAGTLALFSVLKIALMAEPAGP